MISRKLILAALGFALASGAMTDAFATTTASTAVAAKPAAVQTTTKVAPKVAIGNKHVRKLAFKHRSVRLSRHALKRMKMAKLANAKRFRLTHSLKRVTTKRV